MLRLSALYRWDLTSQSTSPTSNALFAMSWTLLPLPLSMLTWRKSRTATAVCCWRRNKLLYSVIYWEPVKAHHYIFGQLSITPLAVAQIVLILRKILTRMEYVSFELLKRSVSHPKTASFRLWNGPFQNAKRAVFLSVWLCGGCAIESDRCAMWNILTFSSASPNCQIPKFHGLMPWLRHDEKNEHIVRWNIFAIVTSIDYV